MFYEPLRKDDAVIAIVDCYSISRFFPPKLHERGYKCINVQSSTDIPTIYAKTFLPQNFIHNIVYDSSNLQTVIGKLKAYNVKHVIPGSEPGVELSDLLSESLGLLTNGTKRSEARRDKFKMIEVLKEYNLQTVEHIKSNDLEKILAWAEKMSSWPIIVKQLKSASSEKTSFCYSISDITQAFHSILDTIDALGNKNIEVLAETYLDGTQYLVNMVSVKGNHILSDLWKMVTKVLPNSSIIHDYLQLLPSSHDLKNDLVAYTKNVLDALEIQYGASHNEVFWTKNGPTLVEMGARMMGAVNPSLIKQCVGRSQMELLLASYLQPEMFTPADMCDYKLKKHLLVKFLISGQSGKVKKINFLDEIKALPSFINMNLNTKIGDQVAQTIDLITSAGTVYLCHENEQVIQNDYNKIASIEQQMFEV
jgi:biotin carboxylase